MALKTFHLFSSLPPEIRRTIYILATPPRVVHIKVPEDKGAFLEELRKVPFKRQLCPSLTHFTLHWRNHIPVITKQPTLDHFGVTGARPLHQPWEPSDATPEIPLTWLTEQPELAWEMLRSCYLYSETPIPALLHTWNESRQELIRLGYELAFRTRSHGPRTWFNFSRDVMYIRIQAYSDNVHNNISLSNNIFYDVGQFHPRDLTRVKRLALGQGGPLLFPWPRPAWWINQISMVLSLFGGLSELLLSEWEEGDIAGWEGLGPHWDGYSFSSDDERRCCLAVEEIDALFPVILPDCGTSLGSVGLVAEMLKVHQQRNENGDGYFEHRRVVTEQGLAEARDAMIASSYPIPLYPWQIPTIRAVHILPESMAARMLAERRSAWERLCEMKKDWRDALESIPSDRHSDRTSTDEADTANSPRPHWLPYKDHGEIYDPVAFCIFSDEQMGGDTLLWGEYRAKSWWTQWGRVEKPGHEIVL